MTKDELVAKLRQSGTDAVSKIGSVPEGAWDGGRYENGWNARQILAHVASIEWTYRRLIDVARQAPGQQPTNNGQKATAEPAASSDVRRTMPGETGAPTRVATGGIDSYNDRQVQKRSDAPVADLIAEFETNRASTIAAVQTADESLFSTPIRSAGGITGTLADVLTAVAVDHVAMHVADITGAKHAGARW